MEKNEFLFFLSFSARKMCHAKHRKGAIKIKTIKWDLEGQVPNPICRSRMLTPNSDDKMAIQGYIENWSTYKVSLYLA